MSAGAAVGDQRAMLAVLQECLLPRPRHIEVLPGELVWGGRPIALRVQGAFSAATHQGVAELLQRMCDSQGAAVPMRAICDSLAPLVPEADSNESYSLTISSDGIELRATNETGIVRGVRTLVQLLALRQAALPCVRIEDAPALGWRGLLIDVARHFIALPELLRTLDGMAHHKLNVLHLHLTDDQAFRFPSRAYPKLNSFGAAYTKAELVQLVEHAARLGIRVVPELDVPGHTTCWLAAYPEWSLEPVTATERFGVHAGCLDPCSETTWQVLGDLLDEFAEVFPDACVHIGGDEVHPKWWREHEKVQAFMAEHELAAPRDLQAWFNQRLSELLKSRGKQMLAWDEALHSELPKEVTIQAWRGMTGRDAALASGHDCIVSAPYYLDLFYPADLHTSFAPEMGLAEAIAVEDAMLEDVRLKHVAQGLGWTKQWRDEWPAESLQAAGDQSGRVIGAEACLWSELVDTPLLPVRLWSRLPLLAELFWCGERPESSLPDLPRSYVHIEHALESWAQAGGPDLVPALCGGASDAQMNLLAPLDVAQAHVPLLSVLEPVKWYARLLGSEALAARLQGTEMPKARPYTCNTPLRGVADVLSPQSFRASQFSDLLKRWRADPLNDAESVFIRTLVDDAASLVAVLKLSPVAEPAGAELTELAQRFEKFGQLIAGLHQRHGGEALTDDTLGGIDSDLLRGALEPVGELMLAVVAPLLAIVEGLGSGE